MLREYASLLLSIYFSIVNVYYYVVSFGYHPMIVVRTRSYRNSSYIQIQS